jgi:hypothetical protein
VSRPDATGRRQICSHIRGLIDDAICAEASRGYVRVIPARRDRTAKFRNAELRVSTPIDAISIAWNVSGMSMPQPRDAREHAPATTQSRRGVIETKSIINRGGLS